MRQMSLKPTQQLLPKKKGKCWYFLGIQEIERNRNLEGSENKRLAVRSSAGLLQYIAASCTFTISFSSDMDYVSRLLERHNYSHFPVLLKQNSNVIPQFWIIELI